MADKSPEEIMRIAAAAVAKGLKSHMGASSLDLAVSFAGREIGVPWIAGESAEDYRGRLVATGKVLDIQPDRVVFAPKPVKTGVIGFTLELPKEKSDGQ